MSIEKMNLVWRHSKATGNARLILLAIADHEGELGAWPSLNTLAAMCNMSHRSVQRAVAELIELEELSVEIQNAPTKTQYKTNLYKILIRGDNSGVTKLTRGDNSGNSGVTAVGAQSLNKEPLIIKKEKTIPKDWKPNEGHRQFCEKNNLDLTDIEDQFRDWAIATGRKYVDWDAGFRTWLRNSLKWSKPKSTQRTKKSDVVDWTQIHS